MIISLKRKILMVDDDILIALAWKKRLEAYSYEVLIAGSSKKAIQEINSNNDIELILMDIDLGKDTDGIETAKLIYKIMEIPVIFVSSHTEREIIERTESVTSFGYIVKGSSIAVYDASIKMAFKLFYERKKLHETEKILKTSLNSLSDAIFISDAIGNLVEFNNSFASIQGYSDRSECIRNINDYPNYFEVYKSNGEFADLKDWALPRALNGESVQNEKYYIKRIDNKDVWIGHYTFNPILDEDNKIIGAIVVIRKATELYPNDKILRKLQE